MDENSEKTAACARRYLSVALLRKTPPKTAEKLRVFAATVSLQLCLEKLHKNSDKNSECLLGHFAWKNSTKTPAKTARKTPGLLSVTVLGKTPRQLQAAV